MTRAAASPQSRHIYLGYHGSGWGNTMKALCDVCNLRVDERFTQTGPNGPEEWFTVCRSCERVGREQTRRLEREVAKFGQGWQHKHYATGMVRARSGKGWTVKFRCRDCGTISQTTYPDKGPRSVGEWWLRKVTAPNGYWTEAGGGTYGPCPTCIRKGT